jgi:osmotically inducible protein OsmC
VPELVSSASASWQGGLGDGEGSVALASATGRPLPVSWAARTGEFSGLTTPEELIAAAHSACYCMALSHELAEAGATPGTLDATAEVRFVVDEEGARVVSSHLTVRGSAAGIDAARFSELAEAAARGCPVSKALTPSVAITVEATLS